MPILTDYYKSPQDLQTKLARRLQAARKALEWSQDEFYQKLFSGNKNAQVVKYEDAPDLLTSRIATKAAFLLNLNMDKLLHEVKVTAESKNMRNVLSDMRESKARIAAACGKNAKDVVPEKMAPVYALFKVLHEMDQAAKPSN